MVVGQDVDNAGATCCVLPVDRAAVYGVQATTMAREAQRTADELVAPTQTNTPRARKPRKKKTNTPTSAQPQRRLMLE